MNDTNDFLMKKGITPKDKASLDALMAPSGFQSCPPSDAPDSGAPC